eukprot:COSAG02_NODE_30553_length_549_cov_0.644444_1_plen_75_part_10
MQTTAQQQYHPGPEQAGARGKGGAEQEEALPLAGATMDLTLELDPELDPERHVEPPHMVPLSTDGALEPRAVVHY